MDKNALQQSILLALRAPQISSNSQFDTSTGFSCGRRVGCDFYWLGGLFDLPDPLPGTAYLSKFPGMSEAAHKVEFTRLMNRMKHLFPSEYSFYPKSWILPDQYSELVGHVGKHKGKVYIIKPDLGSQGDGIYLMTNPYDVHFSPLLAKPCIVQEYISNPLLLEKFKFDLRIYVLVKCLDPLEIYVCREGMGRFCTEVYRPPSQKNLHRCYMHLTNYSLNKYSSSYVQSDDDDKGSKRKLSCVFKQLQSNGCNIETLWTDIDFIICRTIIAFMPNLLIEDQIVTLDLKQKLRCFQVLGFDILIDEDFKPILLEVNSSPSLKIDHEEETSPGKVEYFLSTTDMEIKLPIIVDAMRLVHQYKASLNGGLVKLTKHVQNLFPRAEGASPSSPQTFGCLHQIYPKLSKHTDYLRILERFLKLFRHFVGVRPSSRMGPTSFRIMARRCKLTDFGFTLAALDILYINMSRRYSDTDSGRASLDFNGFYESLLAIGQRRLAPQGREPISVLRYVLRHCEMHLEKPAKRCRPQAFARSPRSPLLSIRRQLSSSFMLVSSPEHSKDIITL
ncbi:predicted protein [Nematostella vectensis]|uniref:Tubulin polyglutamylase TTLL11 n=1 Tax=Nematostella vectensis TaxID=45351 RepID=A7SIH4_NEMVE|nr:predicted protein [Nematostella vectensis]|eukprot:XP_001628573.1 predicted protein [Nematostella vectensis]